HQPLHFVSECGKIERGVPEKLTPDQVGGKLKLPSPVLHSPEVVQIACESVYGRDRNIKQQIARIFQVVADAPPNPALQQSELQRRVNLGGLLPLQVGIGELGQPAAWPVIVVVSEIDQSQGGKVADLGVTGLPHSG